jgi:hypothetical protein
MKPSCTYCATSHSEPNSKRCKIIYLLDHWDEIHDPDASKGRPGTGDAQGPTMPHMSHHPTVLELARLKEIHRQVAPVQHSHLAAYHGAEWRIHRYSDTKRRKGGKTETVDYAVRQRLTPAWVRLEKVRRAHAWFTEMFNGQVFLPDDLYDALHLDQQAIEEKQARRHLRRLAA